MRKQRAEAVSFLIEGRKFSQTYRSNHIGAPGDLVQNVPVLFDDIGDLHGGSIGQEHDFLSLCFL